VIRIEFRVPSECHGPLLGETTDVASWEMAHTLTAFIARGFYSFER
jgi:hypothetical protein